MLRGTIVALLLSASTALGAEQVVWQIGRPDGTYKELAIAGDYPSYPQRFGGKPVAFEVGRDKAESDWPFIQPGPTDTWAGSREHPRTIRFTMSDQPHGIYRLKIELVDVHAAATPGLKVAIDGREGLFRFPPGGGDASLSNPRAGKPQAVEVALPAALFKKGVNEIVLTVVDGSWVLYDAVTLRNDPAAAAIRPEIQSVTVTPTMCFIRRAGAVQRAIDVSVVASAATEAISLRVKSAGTTTELPLKPTSLFGTIQQEVGVPEAAGEVEVTASVAGRSKSATAKIPPQKKWKVFVAPSAHTDIGYTDIQPKCIARHNENTDRAIELCEKDPQFRWNLEVAWQAENYLAARSGERLERFLKVARNGQIGVQALYCNILSGLCSHEQACRLTAFGHDLSRRLGVPYRSAMISDVPTQEATLPMILANSGIRYFSSGINNERAYPFTEMYAKSPAWWEGPDGSRVLMMWVPGYAHASGWGLDQNLSAARAGILANLRAYDARKDYPVDAVFLHGACSDNQPINPKLAQVVKDWNERYEYPKLILCLNAEFFEYVEKQCGDKLPVYRGSGGTYWEDGAGSSAHETTMVRHAQESVANAERFLALAQRIDPRCAYPARQLDDAWHNCLLYDEHTWGAYCSISQPETEFTKSQWKIKAQYAVDAERQSRELYDQDRKTLAALVQTDGPAMVVINPSSWPRSDVVRMPLPEGMTIDGAGEVLDGPGGTRYAWVRDVPACGYRVLKLHATDKPPVQAEPSEGTTIESDVYRVTFDPQEGAITSIVDKELGKELVDAKAPFKLNQYVHAAGGKDARIVNMTGKPEKLTITTPRTATLRKLRFGTMGEMMVVETAGTMAPRITSRVIVGKGLKRIDLINHLDKTLTYDKEGVYFAFPFAAQRPTFRYEVPAGVVCANTGMLPGACREWFTVQHFVEIDRGDAAITWATPDAPLACFQDLNRGAWPRTLDFVNGHVFAYVMNNYWYTNYLAGQGGQHTFRFSITSRARADTIASARFGAEASNPLEAVAVGANSRGPLAEPAASLVSIDEPNVMVLGTRKSASGNGLMIRLWEVTGQPTTAHVRVHGPTPKQATACNLVEDPQGPLGIHGGAVSVPIRGAGLATVVIE